MPLKPLAATCLAGLFLFCCALAGGCNGSAREEAPSAASAARTDSSAAAKSVELPPPRPLFDGWARPRLLLAFTGQQNGYLEPCGCSLTQAGGVSRRADFFRQLTEREWPAVAFDLGNTLRRHRRQSEFKFETILDALNEMPYAGLGIGPAELKLGAAYLIGRAPQDDDSLTPTFLSANVTFFDAPDLGTPVRSKVVTVDGVKVGVTSLLSPKLRDSIFPAGANVDITITDPAEALPPVIRTLQAEEPDLLVLLAYSETVDESRALAEQFPDFDLILTAGGPEDPDGRPQHVGKTTLITVGQKGKYVGAVGWFPDDEQPLRFELVELDNRRFKDTPKMQQLMAYYQDLLKESRDEVFEDLGQVRHVSGWTFVGAEKCGTCHTKAYQKWKNSKHAHAYESLITGRPDYGSEWVVRVNDPECLACHVTGWEPQQVMPVQSGFFDLDRTPHLKGQQCENCHGPGSRHVELEELWKTQRMRTDELDSVRQAVRLDIRTARENVCFKCHDLDNSPDFTQKFEKCWEEIRHPWRD